MAERFDKELESTPPADDHDYPVMPLRNTVLFPQQVIPIYIGREKSLKLIEDLGPGDKHIVVVAQEDGSIEDPKPEDLYAYGTLGVVLKVFDMPDNSKSAIVQGVERVKLLSFGDAEPYYTAVVERIKDNPVSDDLELDALAKNLRDTFTELIQVAPNLTEEHSGMLSNIQKPSRLADRAVSLLTVPNQEKQEVLEELEVKKRVEKTITLLTREIQRIKLGEEIQTEVHDEISKTQREYYLREQMKAIKRELGEDEETVEIKELEDRIKAAGLPEEAEKVAMKELDRLTRIPTQSPEYSVSRTYIEWLADLPWSKSSDDQINVKKAEKILDEDHYGLEKVKERILEYLAVRNLKQERNPDGVVRGPILCFSGPPGVGKTSLGKSIARAIGREFVRMSLGGVRDEAEIRGHRRTYIGAMPGKLVQALKEVEVQNPVIMLDEIDKIGASFQGDPASALLEVLDPEQNGEFLDHYLDLRVDLSKVLFICTANQLDTIPAPLLDRMETIRLSGYLTGEKLQIARHHLWPRQLRKAGLKGSKLKITDGAIRMIVDGYAREAGVRGLDKLLGRIVRKSVVRLLQEAPRLINVSKPVVEDLLGAPIFRKQQVQRGIGVVNGLAWTALGGTTLAIEAQAVHLDGRGFKQTGQLGDVMQESAQIAYSHVAGHASVFGAEDKYFDNTLIHLHVPEGATPKDGPSAGVTMATALVSLARRKQINRDIAMTGELTLTGRVLPVGGIREKIIAARRAGIRELILPHENLRDYDEMPDYLKTGLKLHFVRMFEEIVPICFG